MKRHLAMAALLALVLTACGGKSAPPATPSGPDTPAAPAASTAPAAALPGAGLRIGVMPKLTGISYFNVCEKGAKEAAAELGCELTYEGPSINSASDQISMIETWIAKRYDAIAVAPNDPDAIAQVLEDARAAGIVVLTWDADSHPQARDFFINQCTNEAVARELMDVMAEGVGEDAKYVIVTGSLTAANQNYWMAEMEKYRQERYPNMQNLTKTPLVSEEDAALATQVTADALKTYPDLQGIFAITSVALPGAAEALRKAGAADRVFLTGLTLPGDMKSYIQDGTIKEFVLWSPWDLGYLTVHAAVAAKKGELKPDQGVFRAGRLGEVEVRGSEIILGKPLRFNAGNINDFDKWTE